MLGSIYWPNAFTKSVTVEAKYLVGEYDILILSAKESSGLGIGLRKKPKGYDGTGNCEKELFHHHAIGLGLLSRSRKWSLTLRWDMGQETL